MRDDDGVDFTHPVLNETVSAIGGDYLLNREVRTAVDGDELIYYTGFFMIDRSCCGVGGCAYALVPGFLEEWHYRTDSEGRPVSRVQPIKAAPMRRRIVEMIQQTDPLMQVTFI